MLHRGDELLCSGFSISRRRLAHVRSLESSVGSRPTSGPLFSLPLLTRNEESHLRIHRLHGQLHIHLPGTDHSVSYCQPRSICGLLILLQLPKTPSLSGIGIRAPQYSHHGFHIYQASRVCQLCANYVPFLYFRLTSRWWETSKVASPSEPSSHSSLVLHGPYHPNRAFPVLKTPPSTPHSTFDLRNGVPHAKTMIY
jgi:hypothetical protein